MSSLLSTQRRAPAREPGLRLTDADLYFLHEGTHRRLYRLLGAHPVVDDGRQGTYFAIWAPGVDRVSVIGDFNGWRPDAAPLQRWDGGADVWLGFVDGAFPGALYKFHTASQGGGFNGDMGDPLARESETAPSVSAPASRIWSDDHRWRDARWMRERGGYAGRAAPIAIYQMDLGSWRHFLSPEGGSRPLTYREAAVALADHLSELGFTHVELLGAQGLPEPLPCGFPMTGLLVPSARFGGPGDLMDFVDRLHQRGIGVILDWLPAHLAPARGHDTRCPWSCSLDQWGQLGNALSLVTPEIRSLLLSAAFHWLERFHIDGLRLNGALETTTPADGGAGASLLRELAGAVKAECPDVLVIEGAVPRSGLATSETAARGRLDLHWDAAWSSEALALFAQDYRSRQLKPMGPDGRGEAEDVVSSPGPVLPLSYVHVRSEPGSLLAQMPGDAWQQRANLRLLLGYLYACPGKKLLFMGSELGQRQPWRPGQSLDWHLLEQPEHRGLVTWVRDLNRLYRSRPALFERDQDPEGAVRLEVANRPDQILALLRRGRAPREQLLAVCNLLPETVRNCRIGVPHGGWWEERLNSDAWMYGGSHQGNLGGIDADPVPLGGQPSSLLMTLPPLSVVFLEYRGQVSAGAAS